MSDAARDEPQPIRQRFSSIRQRTSVEMLLRTAQQHHVSLSILADTKASILITISSIVLTLALSRSGEEHLRPALMTLAASSLLSLVLAIIAVVPAFAEPRFRGRGSVKNLLFFGHFGDLTESEFMDELEHILSSDASVYEAAARDIYSLGRYLYTKKFRFLRYAYVAMLAGFILATAVQLWAVWR